MSDGRISLEPLPTDVFLALPERERSLQSIGDVVANWIKWTSDQYTKSFAVAPDPDVAVMLPNWDNAPPCWPSVGQLTHWLEVIRAGVPPPAPTPDTDWLAERMDRR